MLGFFVRKGARLAIGAVGYYAARGAAEDRMRASMPYALEPRADGESALFEHRAYGFAHLVPGFPRPGTPTVAPIEHPHDAMVAVGALPICVRYHGSLPQVHAASAHDFATRAAQALIGRRAAVPPAIHAAHPARVAAWGAEAAVLSRYDLVQPDALGADREELVLLVRAAHAVAVTYRYPRAHLHWVSRAFFVSAANVALGWNYPWLQSTCIWPESTFLEPGVQAALLPKRVAEVSRLAAEMALDRAEREALSARLAGILEADDPPWQPVDPGHANARVAELSSVSAKPGFRAVVERQVRAARSMHDLRGVALQLGQTLEA